MNRILLSLTTTDIIWIVIAILAGIAIILSFYLVLDKFFFAKKRAKKLLKELERKYEYLHALLTGQDAQYIQRLEIISRTNLLYCDIHSNYFRRYKDIRDSQDQSYQDIISKLSGYIEENKIKEFKIYYKKNIQILQGFEKTINTLNADLINIIKPEEDARQQSLVLKEKFRELKSKFNSNEANLSAVQSSFKRVFDEIDKRFIEFDALVETAEYDEANEILPTIDKVMSAMSDMILTLPSLINRTLDEIPTNVSILQSEYNDLVRNGYPLINIDFDAKITIINQKLDKIHNQLLNLSTSKIDEELELIEQNLEDIRKSLELEKEAKIEFDEKYESVNNAFNDLERDFIKISNNIPKISKIYLIDEEHEANLKTLRMALEMVSKDKRRLEVYVHSLDKTPYTILVQKTNDLDNGTSKVNQQFTDFIDYIGSLKNDSETIYANINLIYLRLKDYEFKLRKLNINNLSFVLKNDIDKSYEIMDNIYSFIKKVPINVKEINLLNQQLVEVTKHIFEFVDENIKYKVLTMNNIILMNRDRLKFSEINTLLNQAENLYFEGKYKQAYDMSQNIMNKLQEKAGNR